MRTEPYLTPENRESKVDQWLSSIDRKRRWGSGPGNSAVLILDMQRFFTEKGGHAYVPSSAAIVPVISNIVEVFGGPIIRTRHLQREDDSNLMTEWWRDRIEGEASELDPLMAGIPGKVIIKEHYSAFHGTDLVEELGELKVDSIIITGVLTDLCCETTARDGFMWGFKVYFVADGTATATEERHLGTLRAVANGFGEVISSKELMSRS
ncbi:MAG: isochorismatase family protein [Thermoplasmatota archaeon]